MANLSPQVSSNSGLFRLSPFGRFDQLFENLDMPLLRGMDAAPRIKMDVVENKDGYTVHAEIPGVKKDDIRVSIDGNMVTISAEVKDSKEMKEGERVVQSERYYGRESRSFSLDRDVDEAQAKARYDNGVLELTLPALATPRSGRSLSIE